MTRDLLQASDRVRRLVANDIGAQVPSHGMYLPHRGDECDRSLPDAEDGSSIAGIHVTRDVRISCGWTRVGAEAATGACVMLPRPQVTEPCHGVERLPGEARCS